MTASTSYDRYAESPSSFDRAERQLGRLIDHDTCHGIDLPATMHRYLDAVGNKTTAAGSGSQSSRPVAAG